jgi:NADH dehydrogenase
MPLGPVLVTGANGNLGRRLLRRLAGTHALRAVVRSERAAAAVRSAAAGAASAPELLVLDHADAQRLGAAASGCTHAVHLVGILKETRTSRYRDAHERSCEALARAADASGLRRIVYPSILGSRPDSTNPCLASKGRAERILLDARAPAHVLRVPMVLGEEDHAAAALRARALSARALLLRGGASLEQPIDAADVVEAIARGLDAPGLDDAVLDLAGPESLSQRALVARAAAVLGVAAPRVLALPRSLALAGAWLAERLLADPPVTRAMLGVLDHDDRIDPAEACRRLGITLTPLDGTLRRCLLGSAR